MKKQKTYRLLLRVLGVSIMALGLLIANIPVDVSAEKASDGTAKLNITGGVAVGIADNGNGILRIPDSVTSIQERVTDATGNVTTVGALEDMRLMSIYFGTGVKVIKANTLTDAKDGFKPPNDRITITIPEEVRTIEKDAILPTGGHTFVVRGVAGSEADRYVQKFLYETTVANDSGGDMGKMEFVAIPNNPAAAAGNLEGAVVTMQKPGPYNYFVSRKNATDSVLKNLPELVKDGVRDFFTVSIGDALYNEEITDKVGNLKLTMPISGDVDLTKVIPSRVYSNESNGSLREETNDIVVDEEKKTVTFTVSKPGEYAIEYIPKPVYTVTADIASMPGATLTIENPTKNYTFIISKKGATGITAPDVPPMVAGGRRESYDISLRSGGKEITKDFGTATVTLPVPADITPEKYKLNTVYTASLGNNYERIAGTMGSDGGVSTVQFSTTHFSEYVLEFAPADEENQDQNQNPDNGNQNQNQDQQNPNNQGSDNENAAAGGGGGAAAGGAAGGAGAVGAPGVTIDNVTVQIPPEGITVNRVDMPKTADMTSIKSIIVILMFLSGLIMLFLSIPEKRRSLDTK